MLLKSICDNFISTPIFSYFFLHILFIPVIYYILCSLLNTHILLPSKMYVLHENIYYEKLTLFSLNELLVLVYYINFTNLY